MNTNFEISGQGAPALALQQNRVLRNTYMLLALSMIPTVIGALVGIQMQFSFMAGSPFMAFLLFMGIAFGFMWGIEKNKNNGLGVALLLGFTFFMGLMLSRILQVALGFSNGGSMIAMAAGGTGAIFFTMATVASVSKRDFSGMGKFLFIGMIEIFGSQSPTGGGNPAQLAHGISVALYNTLFGIGVAIPAVIFYRHFRNRVDVLVVEMESQAIKLVEILRGERRA